MTEIEVIILGLINERPRYGYEIEELIAERGIREWTRIAFSSIYYILKRLDKAGLVTWEFAEAKAGAAKKVYRISKKGREALKENIIRILSTPDFSGSILPGLANLPAISKQEALLALGKYKRAQEQKLEELIKKKQGAPVLHVVAMFDYGIGLLKAEIDWLDDFIDSLKKQ